MSIAPMQRVVLCGMAHERDRVLSALQELGCLHLIPLKASQPLEPETDPRRRRATAAYKHLTSAPVQRRPWPARRQIDIDATVDAALANKERLRVAGDRRDLLRERIDALAVFGDFELPPEPALRGRKLWFYILPVRERRALDSLTVPWAVVGRDNTRLFLAVVSVDEPPADLLPVARVHTGSRQLSHLREDLQEVEIEIEVAEEEHAELTRSRLALGIRLADAEDADARVAAQDVTLHDDRVFAVSGWAPADRAEELRAMAEERGLALTLEPAGSGDEPPTLLENPERFAGAGALTSFYTTPPYGAWDPSLVVLVSFALFFAMILADAGYALVLLAFVFLYRRRIGASVSGKRLLAVLWAVLGTAAGYGVLAGSYFGFAPPAGGVLAAVAFIDIEDFDTMMTVSIIIGVVHVSVANLEVAIRSRVPSERQTRFAWVATAWGGLVFWLGAPTFGAVLLGCGLLTIFVSGALGRPVTRPMDWLLRLMDGGLALTRLSTLFGDVLSYMRLFALGLASASLATTFNGLARDIAEGLPGVGLFLAILVLILGHAINLLLGIVSGVLHGLRLNFIEFFGWALSGEGYPFRAFARKERPKWTD